MADPTLSTDMLVRAFMPAPDTGQQGARLKTVLVSLGALASWMTTTVAQNAATVAQVVMTLSQAVKDLQSASATDEAAISTLKAKLPDPIAASVSFSGLLAVGKQTKTVTGLTSVKKGDRIVPTATAALPGNLMLGAAYAPADGQVSIEFGVLAAVTLTAVQVPLVLTVLR